MMQDRKFLSPCSSFTFILGPPSPLTSLWKEQQQILFINAVLATNLSLILLDCCFFIVFRSWLLLYRVIISDDLIRSVHIIYESIYLRLTRWADGDDMDG